MSIDEIKQALLDQAKRKRRNRLRPFYFLIISCVAFMAMKGCDKPPAKQPARHIRPMYRANCWPLIRHTCMEVVESIGKAENSRKYPYGIMIKTEDPWQVCMNTVKHNVMRYVRDGEPEGDFIKYLSLRYSPTNAAIWERNVKYFLAKKE